VYSLFVSISKYTGFSLSSDCAIRRSYLLFISSASSGGLSDASTGSSRAASVGLVAISSALGLNALLFAIVSLLLS